MSENIVEQDTNSDSTKIQGDEHHDHDHDHDKVSDTNQPVIKQKSVTPKKKSKKSKIVETVETEDTNSDTDSEPETEQVLSFWNKYKYILFFLVLASLGYIFYIYYFQENDNSFNFGETKYNYARPLEPFYSPVTAGVSSIPCVPTPGHVSGSSH